MALLEIRDLNKSFAGPQGSVAAVPGVPRELNEGDFVAVRGPSGCGKTTLLLAAGGMLQPDRGQVVVDGQNLYVAAGAARAPLRAEKIGFVFQQFYLVPYLTVVENLEAAPLPRPSTGDRHRGGALLEKLGLAGRRDHVPAQLSTGERQRTALARALLNRPRLLLADEPTGNLDPDNGRIVLNHLADFAAGGGALLLVTHEAEAAGRANKVLIMNHGTLTSSPSGVVGAKLS